MARKMVNMGFSEEFHKILTEEAHKYGMSIPGYIKYLVIKNIVDKEEYSVVLENKEDGGK